MAEEVAAAMQPRAAAGEAAGGWRAAGSLGVGAKATVAVEAPAGDRPVAAAEEMEGSAKGGAGAAAAAEAGED